MKIRLLGTGHGECKIKKVISKDYRHLGGVIVNSKILIDAPHDLFDIADELGLSDILNEICVVLISHSHKGHFSADVILKLAAKRRISVLADREVLAAIPESENIGKYPLYPYRTVTLGAGCRILPLPAAHRTENPRERCLNFFISDDKNLLYALDGGLIECEYMPIFSCLKVDAVILDAEEELSLPSMKLLSHGSFETAKLFKGMLENSKAAGEKTKFIISHIPSSKKRKIHEELTAAAEGTGITVAYDGYYFSV